MVATTANSVTLKEVRAWCRAKYGATWHECEPQVKKARKREAFKALTNKTAPLVKPTQKPKIVAQKAKVEKKPETVPQNPRNNKLAEMHDEIMENFANPNLARRRMWKYNQRPCVRIVVFKFPKFERRKRKDQPNPVGKNIHLAFHRMRHAYSTHTPHTLEAIDWLGKLDILRECCDKRMKGKYLYAKEMKQLCKDNKIKGYAQMKKMECVDALMRI